MTVAKRFPRDEQAAAGALLRAADRVGFAERASYAYPRGGSTITGPSIILAREFMRAWGNIESGFAVIDANDEWTTIEAWAIDLQTNARKREQRRFRSKIQRKNYKTKETEWVVPDERDYGELVNRNAAKAERNAILALMPRDVVDDCLDRCLKTLAAVADGRIKADPERVVRNILATYQAIGVTRVQLEEKIGCTLEGMSGEKLEELRGIYRGISSGEVEVSSAFPPPVEKGAKGAADVLRERLGKVGETGDRDGGPTPKEAQRTLDEADAALDKAIDHANLDADRQAASDEKEKPEKPSEAFGVGAATHATAEETFDKAVADLSGDAGDAVGETLDN